MDNFDIIDNASSTHNVPALDSVTKVTIFGKVSCQRAKELLASKKCLQIIQSFVDKSMKANQRLGEGKNVLQ